MQTRKPVIYSLLFLLVISVMFVPSVSAGIYTEGFEEFTAGDSDPENDEFTFSATGASTFVSSAQAHIGTKSLKYEGTSNSNHATLTTVRGDLCQIDSSASNWLYMENYPDAGDFVHFGWTATPSGADPNVGFSYLYGRISDSGTLSLFTVSSSGSISSLLVPGTFPLSTWVDFTFEIICATNQASIFSSVMDTGISLDGTGSISVPLDNFFVREATPDGGHVFFVDDILWTVDETIVSNAADTLTFTDDAVSMAVLENGEGVAVMTEGASASAHRIRFISGFTLNELSTATPLCTIGFRPNTLAAIDQGPGDTSGFSYLSCDGMTDNVEYINFVDPNGDAYQFPDHDCVSGCEYDSQVAFDSIPDESDFTSMDLINGGSISFSSGSKGVYFLYGVGDLINNDVHELMITFAENEAETILESDFLDTLSYAGTGPDDVCSEKDSVSKRFYAHETAASTKGYEAGFSFDLTGDPNLDLSHVFTGGGPVNLAQWMDCAEDYIITTDGIDTITLLNVETNTLVWSITVDNAPFDVSISQDGLWATYSSEDTDRTYMINGLNGTITCELIHPNTEGVVDSFLDQFGQNFYLLQTNTLSYYSVQTDECTTEEPVFEGPPTGTGTSTGGTTTGGGGFGGGGNEGTCESNFLGINISYVASAWNTSETPIRWLLGILLLVLVVYGFAKIGAGAILIGAAVVIGVGAAVAFCLFPVWLLLVIILLIALGVGSAFFNDNNEG